MLSLRQVSTDNATNNPLTDISLEAGKGEVIVVIGPSGAGKSRLLNIIADPESRFAGEIIVNHFHSRQEPDKVKTQVGYVSTTAELEPYLTGFEYLELIGAFYHLSATMRSNDILTLARRLNCQDQLYSLIERQGSSLQQKLQLISSLLHQPALLVWDEPINYLDPSDRLAVTELLKEAVAAGRTAIVATNDLVFAQAIADRLVLLKQGRIIAQGSLTQLQHLSGHHKQDLPTVYQQLLGHD